VPAKPAKSTVAFYPDTCTLSYAAAAGGPNASPGDDAIAAAIRHVSAKANLCLSYTHLMEFTRGGVEHGMPEADLIDALDTVWLFRHDLVEQHELRNLLQGLSAGVVAKPRLPSAPSFLSQFEDLPLRAAADFLRYPHLKDFLFDAAADTAHRARLEVMAAAGRTFGQQLFEDRMQARNDGVSHLEFERRLDEKFIESIRTRSLQAHAFLEEVGSTPPDRALLPALLPGLREVPRLLPMHFIMNQALRGAGMVAARKDGLGSKYFTQREGDLFDLGHLVGSAYCEGFCCDKRTAEQLGDARAAIGLPPAIVFKGDKQILAKQILASVSG
jgi:hypothetical protein